MPERYFLAKILVMEQCVKEKAWARIFDTHGGDIDNTTFNTVDPHELANYVNALADDPSNDVPVARVAALIESLATIPFNELFADKR